MNLKDRELLAKTLQAEAGNQGYNGMVAVGSVIMNRLGGGSDLGKVILQPGQFSAWNSTTGYAGGEQGQDMDFTPSAKAYEAADYLLSGNRADPTGGATHYYNPQLADPIWGASAGDDWQTIATIGAHVFGKANKAGSNSIPNGALAMDNKVKNQPSVLGVQTQPPPPPQPRQGLLGGQGIGSALGMSEDFRDKLKVAILSGSDPRGFAGQISSIQEGMQGRKAEAKASDRRNKTAAVLRQRGQGKIADLFEQGLISGSDVGQYLMAVPKTYEFQAKAKALMEANPNLSSQEALNIVLSKGPASGNPNVQSSKMLPDDSGVVLTMKNGDIVVKTIGGKSGKGEILFGQAALDFANSAHDKYTSRQESVNKARRTGTNVADIETGGEAASANQEGQVTGGKIGELKFELAEMQSSMPGLQTVVQKLSDLSDTATYTKLGVAADTLRKEFQLEPGAGAIDRDEYLAVVDNQVLPLLRQTFGAQFTVEEGKSLRATLGDPDKTPASKKRVLNAFIEQKERNILAKAEAINILNQPFKFNNVQDTIVSPTLNPVTAPSVINGYIVEEVID